MNSNLVENSSVCAVLLAQRFAPWKAPALFLQWGAGFTWNGLFDDEPRQMPLADLPGMPAGKNPDGEEPILLYGTVCGQSVLLLHGHRHLYENLGIVPCVLPLCAARKAGAKRVLLVEGALSLNRDIRLGSWAILTDFINGHAISPLDGHHAMLHDPFPDMSCALSQELNSDMVNAFVPTGMAVKLAIYHSRPGSQFCTPSEAAFLRQSGADLTGHDLVMEIIMGHALGCQVSACVLAAATEPVPYLQTITRASWRETCAFCSTQLVRGLRAYFQQTAPV